MHETRAEPGEHLPAPVVAALEGPTPGARIIVNAAGIPFSALTWGDAASRPLVLLHGVLSSAATWWRVGPALAATDRRVVAPDMPGHGLTGNWRGHHRFRDNAVDIASFVIAAGLDRPDLQVVGHSWGAMTAAALPAAGLAPATIILIDPPTIAYEVISLMALDPGERTYTDLGEAIAATRAANPAWSEGDVAAKAEALTQLDEAATRSVLLDNGDWDGGLGDLADPSAAGLDVWLIRGDPAEGGYVPDASVPAFERRLGKDHVISLPGAPHSPHRMQPEATLAAILRALEDQTARRSARSATARR
jgi:pimeloyl-ACP methyl ester carboxylesterase